MESDGNQPTDEQLARRDSLVHLLWQAMAYSDEMAPPAAVFHRVTRVAVDVTFGHATDADLLVAAQRARCLLNRMVEAQPLRRALSKLISDLNDDQLAARKNAAFDLDEEDNSLPADGDPPRKQRAP